MAFQPQTEDSAALLALQNESLLSFNSSLPPPPPPPSSIPPSYVVCRVRPPLPSEADSFSRVTPSGPAVHVHKPAGKAGLVDATGKIVSKKFQVRPATEQGSEGEGSKAAEEQVH